MRMVVGYYVFSWVHLHNLVYQAKSSFAPHKSERFSRCVSSIHCSQLVGSATLKLHQFYTEAKVLLLSQLDLDWSAIYARHSLFWKMRDDLA